MDRYKRKPKITYPCEWVYKVIGTDETGLRSSIARVFEGRTVSVSVSNRSRGGRYVSLDVELVVLNEGDRTLFYDALKEEPGIRIVL